MNFDGFDKTFTLSEYIDETVRRIKYYFSVASKLRIFFALLAMFSIIAYLIIGAALAVFGILEYSRTNDNAALAVAGLFTFLIVTGIGLCAHGFIRLAKASLRMQMFAADNKFTFLQYLSLRENQGFAFAVQTRRFARNGATGKVGKRNFWLFEYTFISGSARHPYPNIFTTLMLEVEKDLPNTIVINKKGRLKIIWPRPDMKKQDIWPSLKSSVKVYSKSTEVKSIIGGLFSEQKMKELLSIHPKAEIQTWGYTLTIFIPGKLQPDAKLAKDLFEFAEKL